MVNFGNVEILSDEVVSFLKREILLRDICRKILIQKIVENAATERNITISSEELQQQADHFRYQHKLESADETHDWLSDQLLTPDDWEAGIHYRLLTDKLIQVLFDQEIKTHFAKNKVDFESAVVYRIAVPYRPLAQELFYAIDEEEMSFYEAAHLYDIDEDRRLRCGFEGKLTRWQLEPVLAAAIFGAKENETIGPLELEGHYNLYNVQAFVNPDLTADIYQTLKQQFFDEWVKGELSYLMHCDTSA
jgi:parvulin-like peptidyl-prolyl isomerase